MKTPHYQLKIVSDFAAAHALRGYQGACQRLHGHNWKIEVEVSATQLDAIGIAIDFKVLKSHIRAVTDELDHYYLNEIPPFDVINPTAENLAAEIYRRVAERINHPQITLHAVTVWETERACARYSEL